MQHTSLASNAERHGVAVKKVLVSELHSAIGYYDFRYGLKIKRPFDETCPDCNTQGEHARACACTYAHTQKEKLCILS